MSQVVEPAATPAAPAAATPAAPAAPTTPATPGGQPEGTTAPKGAPEKYADFKIPEGMHAQPELISAFSAVAKARGLDQDTAQELVTFQMESMRSGILKYEEGLVRAKAELPALIAKDPELGGADAVAKAATMQRAIEAFGSPELKKYLDAKDTSNEAYIAIARFALKAGQKIKEDSVAGTQEGPGAPPKEWTADDFYAKAQKPTMPNSAAR